MGRYGCNLGIFLLAEEFPPLDWDSTIDEKFRIPQDPLDQSTFLTPLKIDDAREGKCQPLYATDNDARRFL